MPVSGCERKTNVKNETSETKEMMVARFSLENIDWSLKHLSGIEIKHEYVD